MNWIKCFVFVILMLSTLTVTAADSTLKKLELNRINTQIQQLEKTLKQDKQQQNTTEQELKTAEVAISEFSQQLGNINASLSKEQTQLTQLKTKKVIAEKKLAAQQAAFAKQLRATYQLNPIQPLKIFLNHEDPSVLTRHATYYRYLSEARITLILEIQRSLSELKENMSLIDAHKNNLKTLLSHKTAQQAQQILLQAKRQALLKQLNESVQDKQQQINQLVANQKALQQLIAQLQTDISQRFIGQPFSRLQHKLAWPVKGTLAASFGSPLDVGDQRLNGVIIKANEGVPVHAISPGKVIFANWLRGFGLLIIINHGNNYMSLYGRNQAISVQVGEQVNAGDRIASTGKSGGYHQAGLYFEIRQNGTPVNPALWCR